MTAPRKGRFTQTGSYLKSAIRRVSETRGFAETRLLTNWVEIAGPETSSRTKPVKITYPKSGFGAVLTLLCKGADAPMLTMSLPRIRDKVNAVYGYNAIAEIRLTQTAEIGFAEDQAPFSAAERPKRKVDEATTQLIDNVDDTGLRDALAALSHNLCGTDPERQ
ncbi:MAG: DciA family protein [Pseudomonadota bacterium]